MNKPIKLYNMVLPIFLLYLFPAAWLAVLPINFLIDSCVLLIGFKALCVEDTKFAYKDAILKTWGYGFLSDLIGGVILLLIVIGFTSIPSLEPIADTIMENPFLNPFACILTILCVLISGYFIYLFNFKITFKGSILTLVQKKQMALWLAIFTAPYTFLLPTTLLYHFAY